VFEDLGAVVEEATIDLREADRVFDVTRALHFAAHLGDVVTAHPGQVKPEVVWNVERGRELTGRDWIGATAARTRLQRRVRDFFSRYDLLLTPAAQVVPFDAGLRYPQEVAGVPAPTYLDWMRSASLISAAGLPALGLPAGFTASGLPVGFQLVADHYDDVRLLRWARAYERRTGFARWRPDLLSSMDR
jgi:amidase